MLEKSSTFSAYILHVHDPLMNLSGLILLLGEVGSTSHSRESQQWRNVFHDDGSDERVA